MNIIAYCLNPNHFHFILEEITDRGIEKFMQKLGGGFTRYFNEKYHRSGVLFQGKFKSVHINSDDYLLFLSAYINLNYRIHKVPTKLACSSWDEYTSNDKGKEMCLKDIIIDRFKNKEEYKEFAESSAGETLRRREEDKQIAELLME